MTLRRSRHSFVLVTVWFCVIALAAVHLPMPLTGDQALYMYGAKSLAEGQALYLDFWDAKQPGVYLFYLLAGALFAFDGVGLHALEALWLMAAAWFAYRVGRQAIGDGLLALLIPLLTAGTYFVAVGAWHMTQPDGLLTTPVAGVAWALSDRDFLKSERTRLFVAGAFASVAAIFKFSVLILPLAMVATVYVLLGREVDANRTNRCLARELLTFLAGLLVPLAAVVIWFWLHGALSELIWTTVQYPFLALTELDHHTYNLRLSAVWFFHMTIFWLPFALAGGIWSIQGALRRERRARPGILMLVWLVAGLVTILMQYHYFWPFHFNQFFVPVGVLAAIGLRVMFDLLRTHLPLWRRAVVVATMMVALLIFGYRASDQFAPLGDALAHPEGFRSAYVAKFNPRTKQIMDSVAAALAEAEPTDSIYVFGDPRFLLASGRLQAVPHNGWALEIMTTEQWRAFSSMLRTASPSYLYVSTDYIKVLTAKSPELVTWIAHEYDLHAADAMSGGWYKRRPGKPWNQR